MEEAGIMDKKVKITKFNLGVDNVEASISTPKDNLQFKQFLDTFSTNASILLSGRIRRPVEVEIVLSIAELFSGFQKDIESDSCIFPLKHTTWGVVGFLAFHPNFIAELVNDLMGGSSQYDFHISKKTVSTFELSILEKVAEQLIDRLQASTDSFAMLEELFVLPGELNQQHIQLKNPSERMYIQNYMTNVGQHGGFFTLALATKLFT